MVPVSDEGTPLFSVEQGLRLYVSVSNLYSFDTDPDPYTAFKAGYRSGYRVLITKNCRKFTFLSKSTIYLSQGLQKGCSSYRRSPQPSIENIQQFKT
jgi:hypothetical protein